MKTVSGQSAGHRKDATAYAAEFLRELPVIFTGCARERIRS